MIISKRIQNANRRFAAAKIIKNIDMGNDFQNTKAPEVSTVHTLFYYAYFKRITLGTQ